MFFRIKDQLVAVSRVQWVDCSKLESELTISMRIEPNTTYTVTGAEAVDFVMRFHPAWFEGRRFRWVRHAWAVHNLVGHPVMQFLAWLGLPKLGLHVHDITTPRPEGIKPKSEARPSGREAPAAAGTPPRAS